LTGTGKGDLATGVTGFDAAIFPTPEQPFAQQSPLDAVHA
jgi:hypothetical protein